MKLSVNGFLICGFAIPCRRLTVIFGDLALDMLTDGRVRIVLTHLHFRCRIARIRFSQQGCVDIRPGWRGFAGRRGLGVWAVTSCGAKVQIKIQARWRWRLITKSSEKSVSGFSLRDLHFRLG